MSGCRFKSSQFSLLHLQNTLHVIKKTVRKISETWSWNEIYFFVYSIRNSLDDSWKPRGKNSLRSLVNSHKTNFTVVRLLFRSTNDDNDFFVWFIIETFKQATRESRKLFDMTSSNINLMATQTWILLDCSHASTQPPHDAKSLINKVWVDVGNETSSGSLLVIIIIKSTCLPRFPSYTSISRAHFNDRGFSWSYVFNSTARFHGKLFALASQANNN